MIRTCLCLLMCLASAGVVAREVRLSDANGGSGGCPNKQEAIAVEREAPRATTSRRGPVPARETKVRPSVPSDAAGGRGTSPRWHSFLPGMFR